LDVLIVCREPNIETAEIRLIDFGFATYYNSLKPVDTKCGSVGYAAPEVFMKKGYDPRVDIFSAGVVFHAL
jgi:serine/threonine protein kinase